MSGPTGTGVLTGCHVIACVALSPLRASVSPREESGAGRSPLDTASPFPFSVPRTPSSPAGQATSHAVAVVTGGRPTPPLYGEPCVVRKGPSRRGSLGPCSFQFLSPCLLGQPTTFSSSALHRPRETMSSGSPSPGEQGTVGVLRSVCGPSL